MNRMKKVVRGNSEIALFICFMMLLAIVFSMFYSIKRTTDKLDVISIKQETVVELPDPEDDVYPYISFVIDTPKPSLENNQYGYSYRTILESAYPNGTWQYYNNSKSANDIDVSAIYSVEIDNKLLNIRFRYIMPYDSEAGYEEIYPEYGGDIPLGEIYLNKVLKR